MKVGVPREVKNNEFRVAITPGGRARARPRRARGLRRGRRRRGLLAARRGVRRRRRDDPADAPTTSGARRPGAQGQGAGARGVPPDAAGPGAVHLPAPGRRPGSAPTRCCRAASRRSPTRPCSCRDGSLPLLAPMSEVAGRMAPQVGAHHLQRDGGGRGVLMGGVSGVYAAKVVVHRRGRLRHERGGDRARHAGRGAAARQERRQAAQRGRDLPGPLADRDVQRLRGRARRARRRPGDRRGPRAGREGADAGQQRAGVPDEAGLGARRHLDRPGRLLRGLAPDHARRTRPTRCTTRSSTASRTCRARCRTPRRTR